MIPKTQKTLEKVNKKCKSKAIEIDNSLYIEYQSLAYEDLESATKEENPRWAVTKAYQALFLMCNSILVKKLGIYSKDHNCMIIHLLYNQLIPKETLNKIQNMLNDKETLFQEITNIRIKRNKYLYLPKTLRNVKTPANQIIKEVKKIIKILGEIE